MMFRLRSKPPEDKGRTMTMGFNAVGFVRWAKSGYTGSADDPTISILADTFLLKREIAVAILSGEVNLINDGDDVLFDWPDERPYPTEEKR